MNKNRRPIARRLLALAAAAWLLAATAQEPVRYPDVVAGQVVDPRVDAGSHPAYRTEWWYVTGWLADERGRPLGFQVTFFRARPSIDQANPSAFAARQILIAHAALIPGDGAPSWHGQRISREGFGLAQAALDRVDVAIDDWRLSTGRGGVLTAQAGEGGDGYTLDLVPTQPPLVNGVAGYSRKGPQARSASYYFSVPQLRVSGTVREHGVAHRVTGSAWLDHEWSSAYLDAKAQGWDWVGLNLTDGGALMAFRIRDASGASHYAGGSYRAPGGAVTVFGPDDVQFVAGRQWRSPHTGFSYPVQWQLRAGSLALSLTPLVDDQESDSRATTGAVYWEGAVTARSGSALAGRGFLELTGYGDALKLP